VAAKIQPDNALVKQNQYFPIQVWAWSGYDLGNLIVRVGRV
jgi:hypothetical protein